MLYKLCLPLHLQPPHQPHHEQHTSTRMLELWDYATRLVKGILDCPGARTSDTRGHGKQRRHHRTNSLGTLNVKAGVKTREHDSRREHCLSREPPGYYFGEMVLLPEYSSRCPWSDVFSTRTPPRGCINKGMLDFLSEEKTMCCTKLLLERAVYCQEQDGKNVRRAAHRSRAQA